MLNLKAIPHTHTHSAKQREWRIQQNEREKNPHITNKSSPIFELKKEDNNIFKDKGYLCDSEVCVCGVCLSSFLSTFFFFQFQIKFSLPLVRCVYLILLSLPPPPFPLLAFRFLYASRACLDVYLWIYSVTTNAFTSRASIVLGDIIIFSHSNPSAHPLHSNSHSLSFSSSFSVCVLFSYATAVLCFATTMWCIFSIHIICMNLKAPFMFHW